MKPVTRRSLLGALGRYSAAVTRHHCLRRRLPRLPARTGGSGPRALHRLLINRQAAKETDGNSPLCFLDGILKPGHKPTFGQEVHLQVNLNKQTLSPFGGVFSSPHFKKLTFPLRIFTYLSYIKDSFWHYWFVKYNLFFWKKKKNLTLTTNCI